MNTEQQQSRASASTMRRVLWVSTLLFVVCSSVIVVFKRTDWFPWIGDCYSNSEPGHFLAYCHSVRFGDYEHFAYYHETEPTAVEHARSAEVLFLGSSNTQFGFSTKAISEYFNTVNTNYYVLGFGHGAQSGVAVQVIEKLQLKPKLVVVNADPFFTGETNATFDRVLTGNHRAPVWSYLPVWLRPNIHGEHERKRWLQGQQRQRCIDQNSSSAWCQGGADTLHRNEQNGHWVVENYRENLQLPVNDDPARYIEELDFYSEQAVLFAQAIGLDTECMVITVTPRTDTPIAFAKALADNIGAPFIAASADGLLTIDGFHLDSPSAQRWSSAFTQEFNPHLKKCL